MLFFRQFEHLLPRAEAWRIRTEKNLRRLFTGLASIGYDVKEAADNAWDDIHPRSTSNLRAHQADFALMQSGTVDDQRAAVESAWGSIGGQSPQYLQDVVRAAGFDVYIHQWWTDESYAQMCCGDPEAQCGNPDAVCVGSSVEFVVKNPFPYIEQPLIGGCQCGAGNAECGDPSALCSEVLANETGYLVNKDFTGRAPPRMPTDLDSWHYLIYWGGENFPERAQVPLARRAEFERKLLQLCPARCWLILLIDYV